MDYLKGIITEYKSKGIIIDTNLLILYIVGFYDIAYIEKFGRVKNKQYTKEDFEALNKLITFFNCVYITPQILAEVSNLSFKDIKDRKFAEYFIEVVKILKKADEKYIPKDILLEMPMLSRFGFTDSSILELAIKEKLPVITDDPELHHILINSGVRSVNMTQIRINIA